MEPLRLVLEDFMGHRRTDIDCTQFSTVLIVGKAKNNDRQSNGVGKSTIFYAIDYVLFGKCPADTLDELVRDGCSKCSVSFEFKVSDDIYKITRTRSAKSKKSDLNIWQKKADNWEPIGQKTSSEVEKEFKKIIKISYEAFRNSILFAQSDLTGLASTNPEGRRVILKEALSLLDYPKMEKIAKEKAKTCEIKIDQLKNTIALLGNPTADIQNHQINLRDLNNELVGCQESKKQYQNLIHEIREIIIRLQHNFDNSSLLDQLSKIQKDKEKYTITLSSANATLNKYIKQLQTDQYLFNSNKQQLDTLKTKQNELSNLSIRSVETVKNELEKMNQNEINGRAYLNNLQSKIEELKTPMPNGEVCPHCRQSLPEDHRKACQIKLQDELTKAQDEVQKVKGKLDAIKTKKNLLTSEIQQIQSTQMQLLDVSHKISNKEIELSHLQQNIEKTSADKEQLSNQIVKITDDLNDIATQESVLIKSAQNNQAENLNKEITENKSRLKIIEKNLLDAEEQIQKISGLIGSITEKINSRNKDLIALEDNLNKLAEYEKEHIIRQKVAYSFSSSGIPTMIIYSILNDLQFEANKFLHQIRPGLQIQINQDLEITYMVYGNPRSYKLLSGGQKFMVAFALKLGLSWVIQHRLGVNIKFLELDEVDQPLDKAALDALSDILKKLQDQFKIFVVTHNDNLKDKFKNAILVEQDDNGSTAKVVSSW